MFKLIIINKKYNHEIYLIIIYNLIFKRVTRVIFNQFKTQAIRKPY